MATTPNFSKPFDQWDDATKQAATGFIQNNFGSDAGKDAIFGAAKNFGLSADQTSGLINSALKTNVSGSDVNAWGSARNLGSMPTASVSDGGPSAPAPKTNYAQMNAAQRADAFKFYSDQTRAGNMAGVVAKGSEYGLRNADDWQGFLRDYDAYWKQADPSGNWSRSRIDAMTLNRYNPNPATRTAAAPAPRADAGLLFRSFGAANPDADQQFVKANLGTSEGQAKIVEWARAKGWSEGDLVNYLNNNLQVSGPNANTTGLFELGHLDAVYAANPNLQRLNAGGPGYIRAESNVPQANLEKLAQLRAQYADVVGGVALSKGPDGQWHINEGGQLGRVVSADEMSNMLRRQQEFAYQENAILASNKAWSNGAPGGQVDNLLGDKTNPPPMLPGEEPGAYAGRLYDYYGIGEQTAAINAGGIINGAAGSPGGTAAGSSNVDREKRRVRPDRTQPRQNDGVDLVEDRVARIAANDGPLMQQARGAAMQGMNERGLIDSSLAINAAQDATLRAALPIAQQDSGAVNFVRNREDEQTFSRERDAQQQQFTQANMQLQAQLSSAQQAADRAWQASENVLSREFTARMREQEIALTREANKTNVGMQLATNYYNHVNAILADPNLDAATKQSQVDAAARNFQVMLTITSKTSGIDLSDIGPLFASTGSTNSAAVPANTPASSYSNPSASGEGSGGEGSGGEGGGGMGGDGPGGGW